MKGRNGFISNSSSSSFIVAFPHIPKNAEDVRQILFGDKVLFPQPYEDGNIPTIDIADIVWNGIKSQKPTQVTSIIEAVCRGSFDGHPDYEDYKIPPEPQLKVKHGNHVIITVKEHDKYDFKAYEADSDRLGKEFAQRFVKKWDGRPIYIFRYGDEDGEPFSTMEHGGIFKRLPHEQISNH